MKDIDLNLLTALDVLLKEGSVTGAARRLRLSSSAMSRTLTRLRAVTGDPLLVRAGRGLVPTPHALALREHVHLLANQVHAVLQPVAENLNISSLDLTFTIRAGGAFIEMLSVAVVEGITEDAPGMRLRFVPKLDGDSIPLRDGEVDLDIGKRGTSAPEARTQFLFRDRYVGVVRKGHPLLSGGKLTAKRYTACRHVVTLHSGKFAGPVDDALDELGFRRLVQVEVPGYSDALQVAANSDLVAMVPRSSLGNAFVKDRARSLGLRSFEIPVRMPDVSIAAMWHPRFDNDATHRWLRDKVASVCRKAYPASGGTR